MKVEAPLRTTTLDETLVRRLVADTGVEMAQNIAEKVATEILARGERAAVALKAGETRNLYREAHTLRSLAAMFGVEPLLSQATVVDTLGRDGVCGLEDAASTMPALATAAATAIRDHLKTTADFT